MITSYITKLMFSYCSLCHCLTYYIYISVTITDVLMFITSIVHHYEV